MPVTPRPSAALRAAHTLSKCTSTPSLSTSRAFSQSAARKGADNAHHEDHYDPPSGWLFGIKPGEKAEREGWEGVWMYGFFGSLGLATVAYAFKPDTSIQTWALEEARRRLEVEGILKEPEDKS
ncbi:hypothetical protein LZ554_005413 [Drepanopeziza brunnea f. sp. 'monogermtubi']|nr:hypothetical protein LZ554_005413 [Drepanopeziza brunnea f. sp. 'monogermtubi']